MNRLNHVAFIMDGNGRWGKIRGKGRNYGHLKGVETVKKIVKCSLKINIPIVTFYVFSSENWKRPKKEISYLFKLIKNYFSDEIKNIVKTVIDDIGATSMADMGKIMPEVMKRGNGLIDGKSAQKFVNEIIG